MNDSKHKPTVHHKTNESQATESANKITGGFKWDNRVRFSMLIMVGWSVGVAIYIIKHRMQRDEEHHKVMLEESLRYMNDEERNKVIEKLREKGITDVGVNRK